MRTILSVAAAVLMLALPANAFAATKTVNVTSSFTPKTVTIDNSDTVRWVNKDNANHQIVANDGTFSSAILRPGQTYSHTFKASGRFGYHDALYAPQKGTIIVRGVAPAVTLGAGAPILVSGQETTLTGTVSNGGANESVTISASPYGTSTQQITKVTTGTGGGFSFTVMPAILTTYTATWKSTVSQQVTIQVRPKLTLLPNRGRMYARVISSKTYAGGSIFLQRLSSFGQWVTVSKLTLGPLSGRIFTLPRRCGLSTYRVYMSVEQAGAGYLDGWSGTQKKRVRC